MTLQTAVNVRTMSFMKQGPHKGQSIVIKIGSACARPVAYYQIQVRSLQSQGESLIKAQAACMMTQMPADVNLWRHGSATSCSDKRWQVVKAYPGLLCHNWPQL